MLACSSIGSPRFVFDGPAIADVAFFNGLSRGCLPFDLLFPCDQLTHMAPEVAEGRGLTGRLAKGIFLQRLMLNHLPLKGLSTGLLFVGGIIFAHWLGSISQAGQQPTSHIQH